MQAVRILQEAAAAAVLHTAAERAAAVAVLEAAAAAMARLAMAVPLA
jgi:hypothetical protein